MTPRRRASSLPWLTYLSVFLAVFGFVAGGFQVYYALEKRISFLERAQEFSHGDLRPFVQETP